MKNKKRKKRKILNEKRNQGEPPLGRQAIQLVTVRVCTYCTIVRICTRASMYVRACVRACVRAYIYIYINVCKYIYIYIYICV